MARELYAFLRVFEAQVVLAECTKPLFHESIGHAIDATLLPTPTAQLLIQAAHQVTAEQGQPPTDARIVLQRLRRSQQEGKITYEQVCAALDFIDTAEDIGGVGDLDSLIKETVPAVQHFAHKDALVQAMKDSAQGADVQGTAERFEKVATLGKRNTRVSMSIADDGDDASIDAGATKVCMAIREPLKTGIWEVDDKLGGGLGRPHMGLVLGGTGDGKSLALCSFATEAMLQEKDVGYVTLEMAEPLIYTRIMSNLVSLTAEEISRDHAEFARRRKLLRQQKKVGRLRIEYGTPYATTPMHIRNILRNWERDHKFFPQLLVIDYIDRMGAAQRKRSYEEQNETMQAVHDITEDRDMYCWTAAQTNRGATRQRKVDVDASAESMGKPRVAEIVLALVRTEDDRESNLVRFRIPKHRFKEPYGEIGPLAMDGAYGRITIPQDRKEPW